MSLYANNVTIGGLIVAPAISNESLLPVFYSGVTYKITIGDLLAQVTKASIGLGNADNTSDANKPISTATAAALATKSDISHVHNVAQITGLAAALSEKALINHMHPITEVVGLSAALDAKAEVLHQHEITGVNGLGAALNAKADANHVHEISAINGLSLALTAKADTVVVNTQLAAKADTVTVTAQLANKADTVTVNSQLALKANTADVNAQLAGKSNTGHTHSVVDIVDMPAFATETYVDTATATKAALVHTHDAKDVTDFTDAVKATVESFLAQGTNVTLTPNDGRLFISAEGGGGGTSNYNAVKIFRVGGEVNMYPYSDAQNNSLDQQIVLGRDLVDYNSYVGDNYTINEVGFYRISLQTVGEVSDFNFTGVANNFVPQAFTKPELAVKYGHRVRNYSGLTVLGAEECIERSILKTQAAYSNNNDFLTAWNTEFYIEVTNVPASISLSSFLGFDESMQDGNDVSITEWLAHHGTTVVFEALANPQTNESKTPGAFASLLFNRYYMPTQTYTEVNQWPLYDIYGTAADQFNSDYYNGTIAIDTSGTYRVTVTCTVSKQSDGSTPNYPVNTLAQAELITTAQNYSGARVLTERTIRRKKIIDIRNYQSFSESWMCEYIVSAGSNSELQIICAFTCDPMYDLGWYIDYKMSATFERLGDEAPAPT
jgi:hypothetical protein